MHKLKHLVSTIIASTLPYFVALLWPLNIAHRALTSGSSTKRVLLVSRNSIAADHLVCISELLHSIDNTQQWVTTDRFPSRGFDRHAASAIVQVPAVHIFTALISHWDLIIFTNHPYGFGVCLPPWQKKLYINHGMHTGKINTDHEEDGVYGKSKVTRPFGRPFYDCMFAASYSEKEFALAQTPELDGSIAVAGFLQADRFLQAAREQPEKARQKLGLNSKRKVVHIISTWGSHSLYATHGASLLAELDALRKDYEFVVSIHPRYDDLGNNGSERRAVILKRFEEAGAIVNHELDWHDYVIGADAAISDHSSLCLYHVLLGHPLLLVDVAQDQFVAGSTFDTLQKNNQRLTLQTDLYAALQTLTAEDARSHAQSRQANLLDYQGTAHTRYLQEIEKLLDC
ncbi:MAG: hypothetical protein ACI9JM_000433 [Halioglobus sp.]|jgi:hypothetical protein